MVEICGEQHPVLCVDPDGEVPLTCGLPKGHVGKHEDARALRDRVTVLEGALSDAIGAIRHSGHPVAMQWIPSLEKKLGIPGAE